MSNLEQYFLLQDYKLLLVKSRIITYYWVVLCHILKLKISSVILLHQFYCTLHSLVALKVPIRTKHVSTTANPKNRVFLYIYVIIFHWNHINNNVVALSIVDCTMIFDVTSDRSRVCFILNKQNYFQLISKFIGRNSYLPTCNSGKGEFPMRTGK